MDKIVEPHRPDCCLCAQDARHRCAHQDAHRYCDDHAAKIETLDRTNVCNMPAKHTFLDAAMTVRARCANSARRGTTVCGHHGGSSARTKAARERRIARANAFARAEMIRQQRGWATGMDPLEVLKRCLDDAWNWVDRWLAEVQRVSNGQEAQLIGPNHLGDEAIRVAYECYADALDRAAKIAKLCLDAGVQERVMKLDEQRFELMATVMLAVAADFGVDEVDARPTIARHLRALSA